MRNKFFVCFLFFMCGWYTAAAGTPELLPWPQHLEWKSEHFPLREVRVVSGVWGAELAGVLQEAGATVSEKAGRRVEVKIIDSIPEAKVNPDEAYRLKVNRDRIVIEAVTEKGVYWAIQTLRQLVVREGKSVSVAGCEITDWPAFRIRGFMHDTGRGYISMVELKHEIARLSQYKINVFHWHLTEDLAWRLESRLFPMLNDSVNFGRLPGKYYTLAEVRELVGFCRQHNVILIPEVDMPGHSAAFRKTFRHDMQSKEGMAILKLLMDEICDAFKGVPYMHIGTDEVGFSNPDFVPQMVEYVRSKGFKVISWNPGWKYQTGEIDMLHMWSSRGMPHSGIPVIDSRLHYLNHYDAFADVAGLYNSTIADQYQGSEDYAGAIVAVWNDRRLASERAILLENLLYPSVLALAERAWCGGGVDYFYKSGTLIGLPGSESFRDFADFERRMLWHKQHNFKGKPFAYVKQTNVRWRITDAFPNEGDLTRIFPPEQEAFADRYEYNGHSYGTGEAVGAAVYLRHVWGTLVPCFYKDPQPDHTAYAYTWVYSPKNQEVGLWACTQNYGRSEKDLPPPAGKWDYRESRIWVNDREIMPPVWTAAHTSKDNEIALGNENFMSRPPIPVSLYKGWNKVLLKLPVGKFSVPEVRLVKWMFTAVFVTPDAEQAVPGLIYSPDRENRFGK